MAICFAKATSLFSLLLLSILVELYSNSAAIIQRERVKRQDGDSTDAVSVANPGLGATKGHGTAQSIVPGLGSVKPGKSDVPSGHSVDGASDNLPVSPVSALHLETSDYPPIIYSDRSGSKLPALPTGLSRAASRPALLGNREDKGSSASSIGPSAKLILTSAMLAIFAMHSLHFIKLY